jgi:DNA mismatch endonuclease (patch repair protein)
MASCRSVDTRPELALRRALFAAGLRYRVNHCVLGCRADIAFVGRRIAVFVDGCFWHRCPVHHKPSKSRTDYWEAKFAANEARDAKQTALLRASGWHVIRIWEHEVKRELQSAVGKVLLAIKAEDPDTLAPLRSAG